MNPLALLFMYAYHILHPIGNIHTFSSSYLVISDLILGYFVLFIVMYFILSVFQSVNNDYPLVDFVPGHQRCSGDLLLHLPFDHNFNDVTCNKAIATRYGRGMSIVNDLSRGHVAFFDGSGYLDVSKDRQCDGHLDVRKGGQCGGYLDVRKGGQCDGYLDVSKDRQCDGYLDVRTDNVAVTWT